MRQAARRSGTLPSRRCHRRPPPPPLVAHTSCASARLPALQVWVVSATGEVLRSYEAYLQKMDLYKQEVWSCKYTGKGGMSFEDAAECEKKAVAALQAVRAAVSSGRL